MNSYNKRYEIWIGDMKNERPPPCLWKFFIKSCYFLHDGFPNSISESLIKGHIFVQPPYYLKRISDWQVFENWKELILQLTYQLPQFELMFKNEKCGVSSSTSKGRGLLHICLCIVLNVLQYEVQLFQHNFMRTILAIGLENILRREGNPIFKTQYWASWCGIGQKRAHKSKKNLNGKIFIFKSLMGPTCQKWVRVIKAMMILSRAVPWSNGQAEKFPSNMTHFCGSWTFASF